VFYFSKFLFRPREIISAACPTILLIKTNKHEKVPDSYVNDFINGIVFAKDQPGNCQHRKAFERSEDGI
jgi:hypothetical protein